MEFKKGKSNKGGDRDYLAETVSSNLPFADIQKLKDFKADEIGLSAVASTAVDLATGHNSFLVHTRQS